MELPFKYDCKCWTLTCNGVFLHCCTASYCIVLKSANTGSVCSFSRHIPFVNVSNYMNVNWGWIHQTFSHQYSTNIKYIHQHPCNLKYFFYSWYHSTIQNTGLLKNTCHFNTRHIIHYCSHSQINLLYVWFKNLSTGPGFNKTIYTYHPALHLYFLIYTSCLPPLCSYYILKRHCGKGTVAQVRHISPLPIWISWRWLKYKFLNVLRGFKWHCQNMIYGMIRKISFKVH